MWNKKKVSVVFSTYNEKYTIKKFIEDYTKYYNDGKVEKFRIKHKPKPFVPVFAEGYDDYKKGISMYRSSNKIEEIFNQTPKKTQNTKEVKKWQDQ